MREAMVDGEATIEGSRGESFTRGVVALGAALTLTLALSVLAQPAEAAICPFATECVGDKGDDTIRGEGQNNIFGRKGDDRLTSGGASVVEGGPGDDEIRAFDGANIINGDGGKDTINAVNDEVDNINCGSGRDKVIFDGGMDAIKNCERKRPR